MYGLDLSLIGTTFGVRGARCTLFSHVSCHHAHRHATVLALAIFPFEGEKGRNAHQPDYTNSMQRFKHYFKSGGKNGQSSKGLYNELYEFLRTGRVPGAQQIDSKSRLKLHYEKVLKPMEQVYHYEPLTQQSESPRRRTSVAGHSASASPFPAFPADATAALEDANTSAQLWMTLQDRLGDISRLLPDLYVGKQSTSIKAVQQGVSRLKEKLGQTQDGYGDLRIVAILGKNRIGKSFMLNQLLALTEAPNSLYNRGNESFESEDAAHCATRLYCDEVFGIGAAEGSNDEFYDRILAKITDVDHVHTGSQERYLARCDFSKVLWSFPKIGDEDWADFTHDGRINAVGTPRTHTHTLSLPPSLLLAITIIGVTTTTTTTTTNTSSSPCIADLLSRRLLTHWPPRWGSLLLPQNLSRYKENYEGSSREDVRDAFLEYLQPKGGRPMSKFCEFLLPSNPSEASVTSHNTYVWGGAQYAIVVKYIGAAALQRLIKSVSRTDNDGGGELRLKQKETLLKMMYRLEHGVVAGMQECDEEDDWVSEEMENEQLPSWWADKGCKKSGAANEADYGNVHPTVRSNFDKIHIIQGSGQRPQDDRVYIKSVLSDLHAEEQKYMQMLIDEIHIIAPSSELTRHTALVDTPGVDDEDPNKFVQLQNALHRSCGFLVYMNTTIEAGQSTLKAMGDHGVLDRVVKGFGKQQDKERDEKAVFVHCYEASPVTTPHTHTTRARARTLRLEPRT